MSNTTPHAGRQSAPRVSTAAPFPSASTGSGPRAGRATTLTALALGAALLAGCSAPSVASMSPDLPKRAASVASQHPVAAPSTPAVTPVTAATTQAAPVDRGDLYLGAVTRKLQAGDRTVVINYWTDSDPTTLSADIPFVVHLSAHVEDSDTTHAVKVSRFSATLDDGNTLSSLSDDRGEFVITPPYSYGTALTIRPGNHAATMLTVSVEFDLLVETAPGSGAFFRQTVLDNVRIALPARGVAS